MTLKIPAGALSAPVAIVLTPAPNGAPHAVGSGYDLSPDGIAFAKPALLSLAYGPGGLAVPAIDSISVAFARGASWIGVTGGRIDTSARTLTISLSNTTPFLASSTVVEESVHALSGTSRVVILEGLYIGALPSWVPTDGKSEILAYFRLPPSASGTKAVTVLISELDFKVKLIVSPPAVGTITPKGVDEFIYTAPHSIAHASLPVKLRVRSPAINNAFYEATRTVHVIRRRWLLNVEFKLNVACVAGSGNEDYSFSYADDQTQGFHLGDDLSLNADPFLGGLPAAAVLTSCACVSTMMGEPGTVRFNLSEASLVTNPNGGDAHFEIRGKAEIVNMLPPIQRVCPNPVPPPATVTYLDDPASFDFDLFLGFVDTGGFPPADGHFTIDEPPLLKIVMDWRSIPE
jgi:hypothetical protein